MLVEWLYHGVKSMHSQQGQMNVSPICPSVGFAPVCVGGLPQLLLLISSAGGGLVNSVKRDSGFGIGIGGAGGVVCADLGWVEEQHHGWSHRTAPPPPCSLLPVSLRTSSLASALFFLQSCLKHANRVSIKTTELSRTEQ